MRLTISASLAVLSCLAALPATAQPVFVRNIGNGSGATVAINISTAVPRSNTIFVYASGFPTATVTITDSKGNAYKSQNGYNNNGLFTEVHRGYVTNPLASGDQILVNFGGANGTASAHEFVGVLNADTTGFAGSGAGGTTSFSSGNVSTVEANELLMACVLRIRQDQAAVSVNADPAYIPILDESNLFRAFQTAPDLGAWSFSGTFSIPPDAFATTLVYAFRSFRFGNLNGDAGVDVFDIVVMASAIVGNVTPGTAPFTGSFAAADVNRDGVIDVFDIVLLNAFIVGNVAVLPV